MNHYRITNRLSGESYVTQAESAQEACANFGWMIGECHVQEIRLPIAQAADQDWARASAPASRAAVNVNPAICQGPAETVRATIPADLSFIATHTLRPRGR